MVINKLKRRESRKSTVETSCYLGDTWQVNRGCDTCILSFRSFNYSLNARRSPSALQEACHIPSTAYQQQHGVSVCCGPQTRAYLNDHFHFLFWSGCSFLRLGGIDCMIFSALLLSSTE